MNDCKDSLVLTLPSIATLLVFIRKFFPYHIAESCRIGSGNIYYGRDDSEKNIVATYTFDEDTGLPVFNFKNVLLCSSERDKQAPERYRQALEELLNAYGLFDGSSMLRYLGIVRYRVPMSTDIKGYYVTLDIDACKLNMEPIDKSEDVPESINYFGLNAKSPYPVEVEVYKRVRAYLKCSSGFNPEQFDVDNTKEKEQV